MIENLCSNQSMNYWQLGRREYMVLFQCLYIIPMLFSMTAFTIIKIEDTNKTDKTYSKDKFTYLQALGLCLVSIFNIAIALNIIKKTFTK